MFDLINGRLLRRDQRSLRARMRDHQMASIAVALTVVLVVIIACAVMTLGRARPFGWEEQFFWAIYSIPLPLTGFFSLLTDGATIGAVLLATLIALALKRRRIALAMFSAGGGAWLVAHFFKDILARGRPEVFYGPEIVRYGALTEGYGVPSGHSAVAAGLAVALCLILPRRWAPAIITLAFLVGISRVYLGVHLPLDVVAGWAIGIIVGYGCVILLGVDKRWKREDATLDK